MNSLKRICAELENKTGNADSNRTYIKKPIAIKDLMLGELLCQTNFLSDGELIKLTMLAKKSNSTLGGVLVYSGLMSSSDLFVCRRVLNRYLQDQDNVEQHLQTLRGLLPGRKKGIFAA